MEARWRRGGGEVEARWRRGEGEVKARWRRGEGEVKARRRLWRTRTRFFSAAENLCIPSTALVIIPVFSPACKYLFLPCLIGHLFCLSPGPVAPIDWVRDCVLALAPSQNTDRSKILIGLNFYGMDFSGSGATRED